YLLAEMLEGYAARLAAERISEQEIILLEECIDLDVRRMSHPLDADLEQKPAEFHAHVLEASRNRILIEIGLNQRSRLPRPLIFRPQRRIRNARVHELRAREHMALVSCLREADAEAAERFMRSHIARQSDTVVQSLRPLTARASGF